MHRKWQLQRTNSEYVTYLARAASVSPAIAQILINRGLKTPEDVGYFLNADAGALSDPFAIKGLREVVADLREAAAQNKAVFVHGDYDADGITSTAIVVEALRASGITAHPFIPNRFGDGYGFNLPAVDKAIELGAGIILTVDCGVSAFEAVNYARSKGLHVIVTDHHEPSTNADGVSLLPEAHRLICPKLTNPEMAPLSGAGIAFKLGQALTGSLSGGFDPMRFLDLAAIGTLADAVPLIGENRIIVKEGLRLINNQSGHGGRVGIEALKRAAGLDGRPLRAGRLAYTVVPRINAAGRLSDASYVVRLLLSSSDIEAAEIAAALSTQNTERQRIEEAVYEEAVSEIERRGLGPVIVLAREGWHEGVIGIVASRLVEKFNRPAFVLAVKGPEAKGSGRSVMNFDIHKGLTECRQYLQSFGGHKQAAGLSLRVSDLGAFEKALSDVVSRDFGSTEHILTLDAALPLGDVTFKLVDEMQLLEPFGTGNPEPILGSKDVMVTGTQIVGKNHLKLRLRSGNVTMDAIGFKMGDQLDMVNDNASLDIAYTVGINEWEGRRSLQLVLKGIRPTEEY